jgi:hypothetical protein
VKSKFLAEKLVLDAQKSGFKCKIFRLGRLVGRMSDGKFQINPDTNVFHLLLKGIMQIGAVPSEFASVKTDCIPVDLAVKEVLAIKNCEDTTYHIMNFDPPAFIDILKAAIGDITVSDKDTFALIFKEKFAKMDSRLAAVVLSNLSEAASRIQGTVTTAEITQSHLAKVNFDIPKIRLDRIFQNFSKGE